MIGQKMNDGARAAAWWFAILVLVALFWPPMWIVVGLIVALGGMFGVCMVVAIVCDEKPGGNK